MSRTQQRWVKPIHAEHFASKQPIFQQDVESKPSPVPVKGWDAISPLSAMEPDYGVILDNCVPRPGWVEIRGGFNPWVQGLGASVRSLLVYRPDNSSEKLFAAAGAEIFDSSTYGMPVSVVSGLIGVDFNYVNFTPAGGVTHLMAVNGTDVGKDYNGTTWSNFTVTGGFNTANAININAHKRRLWLIEKNSSSVFFLDVDAITGPANELQLGSFLTKGSNIIAMGTWTIDGGNGPDDYAVFMSNKGQAVVYKGTDPANPNAWFLIGVFDMPPPLGMRCFTKYGSDLLYISLEGLVPISKALPFDPSGARSVTLTNRIQNAMAQAAAAARLNFGWEVKLFPSQTLLVFNIPTQDVSTFQQFVMNTITGAWCRFTGWNGSCFEIYNESLYFGGVDGSVNLAYAGGSDKLASIVMDMKCAFNYYDDPGRVKIIQMIRPFIFASGQITPTIRIDVDFGDQNFNPVATIITPSGSLWDVGLWDSALWSLGATTFNDWQSIGALGTALAIRAKLSILSESASEIANPSLFDSGLFDSAKFDGNGAINNSGQNIPVARFNQFQVILEHGAAIG